MSSTYNEPLVSIVIPVYNAEEYLEETLRSISMQSYKNLEIICVDDGSSDNSIAILQRMQNTDPRFIILSQEHQGAGTARNLGMDESKGDYILFFDADDILRKKAVQTLVKLAQKNDTDIVLFRHRKFAKGKRVHGMPWNKLYKMSFLRNTDVRFQALKNTNDEYFSRITTVEAERIMFINKVFVDYRVDNKNSLQRNLKKSVLDCTYALEAIIDELKSRGFYETYCDTYKKLAGYVIMLKLQALTGSPEFEILAQRVYNYTLNACELDEQHLEKCYQGAYRALRAGDIQKAESELMAL